MSFLTFLFEIIAVKCAHKKYWARPTPHLPSVPEKSMEPAQVPGPAWWHSSQWIDPSVNMEMYNNNKALAQRSQVSLTICIEIVWHKILRSH